MRMYSPAVAAILCHPYTCMFEGGTKLSHVFRMVTFKGRSPNVNNQIWLIHVCKNTHTHAASPNTKDV